MLGLGPLEPLLAEETISEIMVNGPKQVYIEQKGKLTLSDVQFRDNAHVHAVATRIVTAIGRRIDESTPLCDARLMDGSRVNIIIPPLAIDGPTITIRKFSKKKIMLDTMVKFGSMSPQMAKILRIVGRARVNILISGGTGSGKTTLLNALSQMIDHGERVVTIEDAAELQLQQPHVVRLETRPANLEGHGEITMRDLLKNALRMRPDRIIVGETRGGEAIDMLQAMNTGHDGSLSTVHANRPREALMRLENMVGLAVANLGAARDTPANRLRRRHDYSGEPHARWFAPHHLHLRNHRHGRRCHHHARFIHHRSDGRGCRRQTNRRIQKSRYAPALLAKSRLFRARQATCWKRNG